MRDDRMVRARSRVRRVPAPALALACIASACAVAPATLPEAPRDAASSRAALATLVVDNQSQRRLTIGYDYLESGGGHVVIGRIEPETVDTMPPVPAREPIVLFARDETGAIVRDTPRAIDIDSTLVWVIARDAPFTPPQ